MLMPWLDKYGSRERSVRRLIEAGIWFIAVLAFALVAWLTYDFFAGR